MRTHLRGEKPHPVHSMQEVGLRAGRHRGLKVEGVVVRLPRLCAGEGLTQGFGQLERPVPESCTFTARFLERSFWPWRWRSS